MFVIHFPTTFKVGDSIDRGINGEPARATYEDIERVESLPKDPCDPSWGAVQRFGRTGAYDAELNEELDRAIDVPWSRGGPGYNAHSYIAVDRWNGAGIRFEVYSTGGGGDVFLFETVADCERAEPLIVDLREEFRAWREII